MTGRPNIVLILNDDMGYSDIGCYGGEVLTPNLDRLAAGGVRLTQFYNTARCSPSRASLLTGLHPHQTGIGILTDSTAPEGYAGDLNNRCITIAEVLATAGYSTYMSGKWHVAHDFVNVTETWPCQRGFQRHYGTISGAGSYFDPNTLTRDNVDISREAGAEGFYYTDAISDNAAAFIKEHARRSPQGALSSSKDAARRPGEPFFLYVAYTAPHWPLHAPEEDAARYAGRFNAGWDQLRVERLKRMVEMGIIDPSWKLTDRDPREAPWEQAAHKPWQNRRMEVYAAQIDRMDRGIGRIIAALEAAGRIENTLIMFLSDNGACEELLGSHGQGLIAGHFARACTRDGRPVRFGNDPQVTPGGEDTYQSYGIAWANMSNTPFRMYKHWTHEGGIATPFIAHWPAKIAARGELRHQPGQLTDVMATVLDVTGAEYQTTFKDCDILPCEGTSMVPIFENRSNGRGAMYWEHEGNAAVREGRWKLVRNYPGDWELYDMAADRTETGNLAARHGDRVRRMAADYQAWANRCGVVPRQKILEIKKRLRQGW
jgi:arylsulfatase